MKVCFPFTCSSVDCHVFSLRVFIYIFWQVTKGRKDLIALLRQQIVNVSMVEKIVLAFILFSFQNWYACLTLVAF